MKLAFLGTGTSHGIPMIGCACAVCRSRNPRNRRLRCSLWVRAAGQSLIVDTPPDFRAQVLRAGVDRVDAVFLTHGHADHIFGLDDLRTFCARGTRALPVYASPHAAPVLTSAFGYALRRTPANENNRPAFRARTLRDGRPVVCGRVRVTPLGVWHGPWRIQGFRFDAGGRSAAYIPDASALPDATLRRLRGVDVMILDALRPEPHSTHLNLEQSLALLERIAAPRSYLTHLCHRLDHAATDAALPPGIRVAYDGLTVEV